MRTLAGVVADPSIKVLGAFLRFDPVRGSAWTYLHVQNITSDNLMRDPFHPVSATLVVVAGSATLLTLSPLSPSTIEALPQTQAPQKSIWYVVEVQGLDHEQFATVTGVGLSLGAPLTRQPARFKLPDPMEGVTALAAIRAADGNALITFDFTGSVELSGGFSLPMSWTALVFDPAGVPLGAVHLSLGTGTYAGAVVSANAPLPPGSIGSVEIYVP